MNVRLLNGFCLAAAAMAVVPYASASVIFERDLPNTSNGGTTYVNSAIGSDRANVMWESGVADGPAYDIVGDTLNFAGNAHVTTFTIYEVANNTVANVAFSDPTQEYNSISLYMTPSGGTPSSLNLVPSSYTSQRVYYPNPNTDYVDGITGHTFPLYAITFTLNQDFLAGNYGFAVDAVLNASNPAYQLGNPGGVYGLYLAASNAGLSTASGATEQGADGGFYYYQEPIAGQTTVTALSPECLPGVAGNPCQTSWDKGSDINVLVAGTETPEPATFGFVGLALAGVWLRRRRQ